MTTELLPNKPTNPYGANQYTLDPRQLTCWEYYATPTSETFGNALRSAIKAGYGKRMARRITSQPWFRDKVRRLNMLSKAEKVLDEMLDMPVQIIKGHSDNENDDDEGIITTEPALVKIKQDTAKFVADRLGKDHGYATRSERTGKDGGAIEHKHVVVGFTFIRNGTQPDNQTNA